MFTTAIAGGMQGITAPDVCNTVVEPVGALADTMKQNEGSTVGSTAPQPVQKNDRELRATFSSL